MTAERLLEVKQRLIPVVVPILRDIRAGSGAAGGVAPRAELKARFDSTGQQHNALISALGSPDEGAISPSEFNDLVDAAMLQL